MLKTKYYKDLNHNYLIVDCPTAPEGENYQLRMITDNHILGLLPVSKRHINGETFLYYGVNSLQVLRTMFEQRKMERAAVVRLLGGLRRVLRELKNYLLSDSGLLLSPEYIYLNWESEEVYFLYYPFENEVAPNQAQSFFEYLVRVIDHRDPELTDVVYGLCQLAERDAFTGEALERGIARLASTEEEPTCPVVSPDAASAVRPAAKHDTDVTLPAPAPALAPAPPSVSAPPFRKFFILSLISAMGAIFTFFYQQLLPLSPSETLLSWILLIVFLIFFLMTGGVCLVLKGGFLASKKEGSEEQQNTDWLPESVGVDIVRPSVDDSYGETIFLAEHEEMRENKLYGTGRASKHIIEITRFPFIIGKLAEQSDYCLTETSISRLHARFTQSENGVCMTDLNSTNGTYKNGIRLEPSETVYLEAGDEVRLGKVEFCFR